MAVTNDARFMHCLPVRRNMIVTDEVIEGPRSIVIPEAANREISAQNGFEADTGEPVIVLLSLIITTFAYTITYRFGCK